MTFVATPPLGLGTSVNQVNQLFELREMLSFTLYPNSVTGINTEWMASFVQACCVTDAVLPVACHAILYLITVKFRLLSFWPHPLFVSPNGHLHPGHDWHNTLFRR